MARSDEGAPTNPQVSLPALPSKSTLKYGRRIFDLNLTDHVQGVWDESIPLVQQCTVEAVGISSDLLTDGEFLADTCERLCSSLHLTILRSIAEPLPPGHTLVFILSESHLALHSWPEKGYINIDLVTCTKRGVDPIRFSDLITDAFKPSSIRVHKIYF
ncbi:MAG TPA: S-adenosylmethionine decarboxylase [Acidimicrobiales bacterium]|jgi:S-adenosylmethionine decarboxylase|nr:S-adenosylmethionine decarboxylase [Acidimicrobiales bacterium]